MLQGRGGNNDLFGGTDCLHPNKQGHRAMAGAFAKVIDVPAVVGPPGHGQAA